MEPLALGNLTQILRYGLAIVQRKFTGQSLEKIHVEGCQPYICVQRHLMVNFILTTMNYSSAYQLYESYYAVDL